MTEAVIDVGALRTAVIIKYDEVWNEYKVPVGDNTFYHTDDRDDAINTARGIYGQHARISVRAGPMPKNNAERFRAHAQRKREEGLVRRSFWIPAKREEEVKTYIEQLTNKEKTA